MAVAITRYPIRGRIWPIRHALSPPSRTFDLLKHPRAITRPHCHIRFKFSCGGGQERWKEVRGCRDQRTNGWESTITQRLCTYTLTHGGTNHRGTCARYWGFGLVWIFRACLRGDENSIAPQLRRLTTMMVDGVGDTYYHHRWYIVSALVWQCHCQLGMGSSPAADTCEFHSGFISKFRFVRFVYCSKVKLSHRVYSRRVRFMQLEFAA